MDLRHHAIQLSASPGSAAARTPAVGPCRRAAAPATRPGGDGGTMSSELYLAVCGGKKEKTMARQHPSGIHQFSAERNNVLHLAAEHGHVELIQELAIFGDKNLLSCQNSALDTPLHLAARAGHDKAVSLLVQLARDCGDEGVLRCKNEAGDTALHLAA
ncbi:Transient receptor potential cation channel subfamily A member 1 [Triticum urartu]|uniref:Transient receptor potential cation channel subfamily A member 1 n=1 Tax=Triticum urartu TaxID=4572 RepID=M8AKT8_TRIUA|nr:Transient receptor potential cation channel subfamily A member 1 [Triticum urartu]